MHRFILALTGFALLAPAAVHAQSAVLPDHSTVTIVLITPNDKLMQFGMGGGNQAMVRVGDMILPTDSVRPVSIKIDGEFVGHALLGHHELKPEFVLPNGLRKFEFSCDGYKTTESEIRVLGTGSRQFLIVRFEPDNQEDKARKSDARKSTTSAKTVTPVRAQVIAQ